MTPASTLLAGLAAELRALDLPGTSLLAVGLDIAVHRVRDLEHRVPDPDAAWPDPYVMNNSWQPIDTAPRDETPILLFSPDAREHVPMLGRCFDNEWYDYWSDSKPAIDADPTHWMPLPAPPVTP